MPRRKLRAKERTISEMTEEELWFLLRGHGMDAWFFEKDSPRWAELWKNYRAEIIEAAQERHARREEAEPTPWAWWWLEAPAPREQISGPEALPEGKARWREFFGRPTLYETQKDADSAEYEDDEQYFQRCGIDPATLKVKR